jgi:uncharacterized protein
MIRGDADELTAPLGRALRPRRQPRTLRIIAAGLAIAVLAGTALWFAPVKELLRGRQTAMRTEPLLPKQVPAPASVPEAGATGSIRTPDAPPRTVTIIDGMSGKRQEVVIGSPEAAPDGAARQRSR